jgi:hypothetical protein
MTYYLSFDKSNMSGAFGWEGTACHFIIQGVVGSATYLFVATLYHGHTDRNNKLCEIESNEREIATLYTGTPEILKPPKTQ